jgi:hypothetical protein
MQRRVVLWQGNSKVVLVGGGRGRGNDSPMDFPGGDAAAL